MKQKLIALVLLSALFALVAARQGIHQEQEHVIHTPDEVEWQDGPASLPPGAEFAVLEGDPGQEGLFTMRIRVPADYQIPPHTHPRMERATVIEGQLRLGMGRELDEEKMETLEQGSYFVMPPGMEHYVVTDEETTIQLTSMGPWEIRYLDPADDPRQVTE